MVSRSPNVLTLVPAYLAIKEILVPIDFSRPAKKALRYAVAFATQFGAKLTLVHVVEPVAMLDLVSPLLMENDKVMRAAKSRLDLLCKQTGIDSGSVAKTLVRSGTPFKEITDAARTLKVDLIVIATHGYSGLKHAMLGSTAERVVRHASCPVLIVREREHEFV
jgi:nucleotide-binding universal stress UspA family protein